MSETLSNYSGSQRSFDDSDQEIDQILECVKQNNIINYQKKLIEKKNKQIEQKNSKIKQLQKMLMKIQYETQNTQEGNQDEANKNTVKFEKLEDNGLFNYLSKNLQQANNYLKHHKNQNLELEKEIVKLKDEISQLNQINQCIKIKFEDQEKKFLVMQEQNTNLKKTILEQENRLKSKDTQIKEINFNQNNQLIRIQTPRENSFQDKEDIKYYQKIITTQQNLSKNIYEYFLDLYDQFNQNFEQLQDNLFGRSQPNRHYVQKYAGNLRKTLDDFCQLIQEFKWFLISDGQQKNNKNINQQFTQAQQQQNNVYTKYCQNDFSKLDPKFQKIRNQFKAMKIFQSNLLNDQNLFL